MVKYHFPETDISNITQASTEHSFTIFVSFLKECYITFNRNNFFESTVILFFLPLFKIVS